MLLGRCQEDVSDVLCALRRGAAPLRGACARSTCFGPTSRPTGAPSPRWSPRSVNDWESSGTDEDGSRHRALPPLRGRGGPSDGRLRARNQPCSCSTTCNGPTVKACGSCVMSSAPSSRHGCSCSGRSGTPKPRRPTRSGDLLGALQREPKVSRIELKGFDDTGVLAFMEAAAGQPLEEAATDLAHALCLETEGNPFFVGEVLRSLMETGAIYQDDGGRWTAAGEMSEMVLPNSVREVVSLPCRPARGEDKSGPFHGSGHRAGLRFRPARRRDRSREEEVLDILDAATGAALVRES